MSLMWLVSEKHRVARRNGWRLEDAETFLLCERYGYSIEQNIDGEYVIYTGLTDDNEEES